MVPPWWTPWAWLLLRSVEMEREDSGHGNGGPDDEHLDEQFGDDLEPDVHADEEDEDAEGMQTVVTVEISGLSLYTHHGVTAAERAVGQRLVLDRRINVG